MTKISSSTSFNQEQIAKAESFSGERFSSSLRDEALCELFAEINQGQSEPSLAWRGRWSLGLEDLLAQETPKLNDGTVLGAHQVDALAGTLAALLATVGEKSPANDSDRGDRRFWFEHATGSGKTVAALGFVHACKHSGVLILTHRRNLVDQFTTELKDRGYGQRICQAVGDDEGLDNPVTVQTYQWFVRNEKKLAQKYSVIICDEAHTALGPQTSAAIRALDRWFVGMTATGALIARHVTDLFPQQVSSFNLEEACVNKVIAPLRSLRIPPGASIETIAKVPLRKGEVEFDQEKLAEVLDQDPFNMAVADLYKDLFEDLPGVVYAAGVNHAYRVAQAFRDVNINAEAVSGQTPKGELAEILARYDNGEIHVLVNAQLLAEGWNSPRATVCLHLAPTASRRVYQQRIGRITRRWENKEAGIVVDFVSSKTRNDGPVITIHSLLGREYYQEEALVVQSKAPQIMPGLLSPISPERESRRRLICDNLFSIKIEDLDEEDLQFWALLAAHNCSSIDKIADNLRPLSDDAWRIFLLAVLDNQSDLAFDALKQIARHNDPNAFSQAAAKIENFPPNMKRRAAKIMIEAAVNGSGNASDLWLLGSINKDLHEKALCRSWPAARKLLGSTVNSSGSTHTRAVDKIIAHKKQPQVQITLLTVINPYERGATQTLEKARDQFTSREIATALLRNFPKKKIKKRAKDLR